MGSLWTQLLLQFLTNLFETLQTFLSRSEDVHQVLGLFFFFFFFFFIWVLRPFQEYFTYIEPIVHRRGFGVILLLFFINFFHFYDLSFLSGFLFVLRFYGPVNPIRSCQARPVYLTTSLLGRLSPLSG